MTRTTKAIWISATVFVFMWCFWCKPPRYLDYQVAIQAKNNGTAHYRQFETIQRYESDRFCQLLFFAFLSTAIGVVYAVIPREAVR